MVKRFDCDREYVGDGEYIGKMVDVPNGDYVSYDDYEALMEEFNELRKKMSKCESLAAKLYLEF